MYPQPKIPNSSCHDLHLSKYQGLILGLACKRNAAKLLAATILINKLLNLKLAKYKRKNTEIITIRGFITNPNIPQECTIQNTAHPLLRNPHVQTLPLTWQ